MYKETGKTTLAYSGGCALNCVTNSALMRLADFTDISIQPASGDAGASLGAAALIERPLWENAFLGYNETTDSMRLMKQRIKLLKVI